MMVRWLVSAAAAALLLSAQPSFAQGAANSSSVDLARKAESLKPGQWVWAPEIAPAGPVLVYVDLSDQTATVYRNGIRIAVSTVSSGKPGHETPTGVFSILQKDADHHSSTYNNAPMPFQERLTWGGVALHAGGLPGYPMSHGCIHLPYDFAKLLFGITHMGGTVIVSGDAGTPMPSETADLLEPGLTGQVAPLAPGQDYVWNPAASPTGPLTLVVSRGSQRLLVLRDGVEIGRSKVAMAESDNATKVVTYAGIQDGKPKWVYVDVPGNSSEAGKSFDIGILGRIGIDPAFLAALRAEIVPGTTMLVTDAAMTETTTGQQLTVMDSAGPTAAN